MTNRKYFKCKITELEEIYSKAGDDCAVLEELEEELEHRSTQRARKLLQNVKNRLESDVEVITQSETVPVTQTQRIEEISETEEPIDWVSVIENASSRSADSDQTGETKPLTNHPNDIIDAWTVIEALSPQSYKKPDDLVIGNGSVAYLRKGSEPWIKGEKSRPKNNLYYQVYLGAIKLDQATEQLLKIYQDKRIERPNVKGLASLAVITLNQKGVPVPETGLSISSFGWAYARALKGYLDDLKSWEIAESVISEELSRILYKKDEDENDLPVTFKQIEYAYLRLVKNCGIPEQDIVAPTFAIRLYQPFSKGEPDSPLLNSFYLDDLQRVKKSLSTDQRGKALDQYIGIEKPANRYDILKDKEHIEDALQPKLTPRARWPGKGRHPLVLLQQTAVNLAMKELKESGLFSVNGPPGTGKTTLLRDVVAGILVDRATALCEFESAENAFTHAGQMKIGNGFVHLYELDERLRGYEIVVASSNNKAVENVSKELPQRSQIAEDLTGFSYFQTISDTLSGQEDSSWGLIAAVLGNSKNRSAFINDAWWDENTGLRNYFLSITGQVPQEGKDDEVPKVVRECDPPSSPQDAQDRWLKARKHFQAVLLKAQQSIDMAQKAYEHQSRAVEIEKRLIKLQSMQEEIEGTCQASKNRLEAAKEALHEAETRLNQCIANKKASKKQKPWFFHQLFQSEKWKAWKPSYDEVISALQQTQGKHTALYHANKEIELETGKLEIQLSDLHKKQQQLQKDLTTTKAEVSKADSICKDKLVTSMLWELSHGEQQKFAPNFLPKAQHLRDDVFVAAVELHKAFIDASAKQLRQNLGAFFGGLQGRGLPHDKAHLLPHLWSSFFLLTPVISTTFASVGRMLKDLPAESLGWLLIDEAGQATPQAAAGAILRSKRVVAVGDPMQIEPVVSLPISLVEGISRHLGVDPDRWMAPVASVQTLADDANQYGTSIPRDLSEIRIGSPLLVHRRCENPMFSISNRLAYANLMVYATVTGQSVMTDIVGQSQWFDITGNAQEKWCPEEGDFVAELILKVASHFQNAPELFVISPFRIVAERMRQRVKSESSKLKTFGIDNPNDWINNSIGTVHTFQGKETQAVILLLGAPSPAQNGARSWATSQVNLLNVAVSRAKQNFYVVGNKALWSESGNMKLIYKGLNS